MQWISVLPENGVVVQYAISQSRMVFSREWQVWAVYSVVDMEVSLKTAALSMRWFADVIGSVDWEA